MIFHVVSDISSVSYTIPNVIYLIEDSWDDWFTYSTMYTLIYVDNNLYRHEIGSLKIGEFNMHIGQRSPCIPKNFESLSSKFFSLGQSRSYYKNLNLLDDDTIKSTILKSLNDLVIDEDLLSKALQEDVTNTSLLRDIPLKTIKGQFKRILDGGAMLTPYNFSYNSYVENDESTKPVSLSFDVTPESYPPTNIHVIIGRNGVGKTHLIKNMINCIIGENDSINGSLNDESTFYGTSFTNIVFVSFSAFDKSIPIKTNDEDIPFTYVGLVQNPSADSYISLSKTPDDLRNEFATKLEACLLGSRAKFRLWENAINILESDPIFQASGVRDFIVYANDIRSLSPSNRLVSISKSKEIFVDEALKFFDKLSSGHKIIMLTITQLVDCVEEKTLVFLDEPESHLHPPLLSAFIRALSNLMISKNAVSIIATHSPVILQEVPKSCVWKLRRSGRNSIAERLRFESFGENVSLLSSEVFGLEVTHSGYHTMLSDVVQKNKHRSYSEIVQIFNNELGMEAKAILRGLISDNSVEY